MRNGLDSELAFESWGASPRPGAKLSVSPFNLFGTFEFLLSPRLRSPHSVRKHFQKSLHHWRCIVVSVRRQQFGTSAHSGEAAEHHVLTLNIAYALGHDRHADS